MPRERLHPIQADLRAAADPQRARALLRFYRTGPGEYGEGDRFLGLVVPATRGIVRRRLSETSVDDALAILRSPWHEERLAALLVLVALHAKGDAARRRRIQDLYLANTRRVNNWDLVDLSARDLAGPAPDAVRTRLATSRDLWERRIAMVSTHHGICAGDPSEAFRVADLLAGDEHDLIRKAAGWMLREAGKRCSETALVAHLRARPDLPRTTLRYAIERLSPALRRELMSRPARTR